MRIIIFNRFTNGIFTALGIVVLEQANMSIYIDSLLNREIILLRTIIWIILVIYWIGFSILFTML